MSDNISLPLELPSHPAVQIKWFEAAARGSKRTEELVDFCRYFVGRADYDCRVYSRDEDTGARTPKPGVFYKAPLTSKILYGTEEEREKGFFISDARENDGTEFSSIRPYTMSTAVDDLLAIPSDDYRLEGISVPSPSEMAYQTMTKMLCLGPCERIFITTGAGSSEHALFCFPVKWSVYTDVYLIYSVGGRYRESHAWLFQGDPAAYAAKTNRGPRSSELEVFFGNREAYPKVHEAPASLPMTYDRKADTKWVDPRPFELREISKAVSVLTGLDMGNGEPYLEGT